VEPVEALGLGTVLGAAIVGWWAPPVEAWVVVAAFALACSVHVRLLRASLLHVGLSLGALSVLRLPEGPALTGSLAFEAVIVGAPTGREAHAELIGGAATGARWEPLRGRVNLLFPEAAPPVGVTVLAAGLARAPDPRALPGAPDPSRDLTRARIRTEVEIERFEAVAGERALPGRVPSHPLQRALVTGDRTGLSADDLKLLRDTGTYHLLSVSGFHVGLVAAVILGLARVATRIVAIWRPQGLPDAPAWWVAAAGAGAFVWGVGAPVAAQRAALGFAFAALGRSLGATPTLPSAVGAAAVGVVTVDPSAVGDASFQLSFGAMAALARLGPAWAAWAPEDWRGLPWRLMVPTFAATAGTLGPSLWWFQHFAPSSPIANAGALPWSSFVLAPCAFAVAWGPAPLADLADAAGAWGADTFLAGLRQIVVPPWHPAVGPWGALLLGTLPWLGRRPGALALIVAVATWPPPRPDHPVATFLDVGQGDCIVLQDGPRTWVIDGGNPNTHVLHWLRREGVRHVDVVVATHPHLDHTGGLLPILDELSVGELWITTVDGSDDLLARASTRGVTVRVRPVGVLHPPASFTHDDANELSLVLRLGAPGADLLLPGDGEAEAERAYVPGLSPVFAVKVPHHGSRTSSTQDLVDATRPTWAIMQLGRDNRHGHPAAEVVARWEAAGATVLRSDVDGTVRMHLGPEPWVETWRPGQGWRRREPRARPVTAIGSPDEAAAGGGLPRGVRE
jgi:competence protein ComEC